MADPTSLYSQSGPLGQSYAPETKNPYDNWGATGDLSLLAPGQSYATEWNPDNPQEYYRALDAVAQARKYDPNAYQDGTGKIVYDQSKLPKWNGPQGTNPQNFKSLWSKNDEDRVIDPKYMFRDPHYGNFTYAGNLRQAEGDKSTGFMGQLGKYMPAVISSIMAAGMGAGAGPLMGGLLSSGIGPGGVMDKLVGHQPINWGNIAKSTGMSLLGSQLPGLMGQIPGAQGAMGNLGDIMKWVNRGRTAYSIYDQINKGRG
jgi:hypothetical protein